MRKATEPVILATVLAESADSAAATVAISAPVRAKMTLVTPAKMAVTPAGANPP